jgi:hypothetical protein
MGLADATYGRAYDIYQRCASETAALWWIGDSTSVNTVNRWPQAFSRSGQNPATVMGVCRHAFADNPTGTPDFSNNLSILTSQLQQTRPTEFGGGTNEVYESYFAIGQDLDPLTFSNWFCTDSLQRNRKDTQDIAQYECKGKAVMRVGDSTALDAVRVHFVRLKSTGGAVATSDWNNADYYDTVTGLNDTPPGIIQTADTDFQIASLDTDASGQYRAPALYVGGSAAVDETLTPNIGIEHWSIWAVDGAGDPRDGLYMGMVTASTGSQSINHDSDSDLWTEATLTDRLARVFPVAHNIAIVNLGTNDVAGTPRSKSGYKTAMKAVAVRAYDVMVAAGESDPFVLLMQQYITTDFNDHPDVLADYWAAMQEICDELSYVGAVNVAEATGNNFFNGGAAGRTFLTSNGYTALDTATSGDLLDASEVHQNGDDEAEFFADWAWRALASASGGGGGLRANRANWRNWRSAR